MLHVPFRELMALGSGSGGGGSAEQHHTAGNAGGAGSVTSAKGVGLGGHKKKEDIMLSFHVLAQHVPFSSRQSQLLITHPAPDSPAPPLS